ncbi:Uma2 family endonuclease [Dactylosporangium sp. NPDC000244]|uniref:Uma2 family endonuclease n=1 Tax=Dactylosporangium sp. NPDC000244 TaxID=3154365 RepID=UPI003320535F
MGTTEGLFARDDLEDMRRELHDGVLLGFPPPSVGHQRVERDLLLHLSHGQMEAIPGIGIVIDDANYRIPDISVLRPGAEVDESANEQAAAIVQIVVEIVSPTSADTDRVVKPKVYARAGIPEYWRVEPQGEGHTVLMHELQDGGYVQTRQIAVRDLLAEGWEAASSEVRCSMCRSGAVSR